MRVEEALSKLASILKDYTHVLVAFSGGVDSTLLLAMVNRLEALDVTAVTVSTPYIPNRYIEGARQLARNLGVRHVVLDGSDILRDERFLNNPPERCYLCKKNMYALIKRLLPSGRRCVVIDGTNADDLKEERPGLRAMREEGVLAPLALMGLTKRDVRLLARELGLPNWNSPPTTCLLTRLPHGVRITTERLSRVEAAESSIMSVLGSRCSALRVRDYGDLACIEVSGGDMSLVLEKRESIVNLLKSMGFKKVLLDLEGYRRYRPVIVDNNNV